MDEAIEKEYIKVFYQPVVRVATGKVCGYEALVRWVDPRIGVLSPGDFIETLETYHLIHRVDAYVVEQVCRDYNKMIRQGDVIVPASINFSRLDFELCDIFGIVEETRKKYNVPRNMLDLVFLRSFDHNPKTAQLMNYIVEGVKGMGLVSLCEGVETETHYEFLKKIGCEKAQGYYFGKPRPYDETKEETIQKGMTWEEYQG